MTQAMEMAELLELVFDSLMLDVHVAIPGRVDSYDAATQTVEVTLLLKRVLEDEDGKPVTEALPKLPPMPVVFSRSAKFLGGTFPLEPGDTGQVLFNEVPIGQWLGNALVAFDEPQSPGESRRHPLSGGVFIPGLYNAARRSTRAGYAGLVVGSESGTAMHVPETGAAEVRTAAGSAVPVVTVSKLVSAIGAMLLAGQASGVGAPNFVLAKTKWDLDTGTTPPVPGLANTLLGATKLSAE